MRVGGGVLALAAGFVLLWAVTQGYTKNLNAAWNSLRGVGTTGGTSSPTVGANTLSLTPITPLWLAGQPSGVAA